VTSAIRISNRRTPAWIRYRSPAITSPARQLATSLAICAGLVNLLDLLSRSQDHQLAGTAAAVSLAEIVAGLLILWRPSRQLISVAAAGCFLALCVSWLAYVFGFPSPRLDTRATLAATGAVGRMAELALLLVLSYAIARRQAPSSPGIPGQPLLLFPRMPQLSIRRVSLVMLTAFAAAALSPLPTAVLDRVSSTDAYRVEPAAAQSTSFLETFSGAPSSPQRFQSTNWDITVTGNQSGGSFITPMDAHHGPGCEPPKVNPNAPYDYQSNPLVTHSIDENDQTVFLCRDHVMTAANSPGYAAIYLTPNRMADFSQGESVIRFDMSTLRTSARDWVDFVIMPFNDNQQLNFQDASFPANAIHISMFNNVGSTRFRTHVIREFQRSSLPFTDVAYDSFLTPDPARRDTFEIRISRSHLRFGMPAYNFWWVDTDISPALTWSQGILQLNQRSYNPGKDESCPGRCMANTWHWDNVSIAPAAPFTIIRANQDVAYSSSPQLTFPQPSPANARLRFAGQSSTAAGQHLQFSTNGGQTWQDAQLQRDGARIGDEWYKSYWTPIAEGVSSIRIRRADGNSNWRIRDVSFWAPGGGPGSSAAPTPTNTASASSTSTSTAVPPTSTRTPPPAAATAVPATPTPGASGSGSGGPDTRIAWQGEDWYVQGANVPWLNWGCDFGCGASSGVSSTASQRALESGFTQLQAAGAHSVRWWMFEGNPWQITRDATGAPSGINPTVYADIDAALRLAERYDLYYDFVLFSAPTAIPNSWITNATHRARLASALGPLFARYRDHPRIMAWEAFNEPEYDIWGGRIAQAPVQATVRAIADAVHANSTAYFTVGSAMLDGLPMWVGQGLDFYQAHWYPSMSGGDWCAPCTTYANVRSRYNLDGPLIIGELYGGGDVDALTLYNDFYASGYAGAWAWSLFPNSTGDQMAIDMSDMTAFNRQHADVGPQSGTGQAAATSTPTTVPATATRTPTTTTVPATATSVPPTATRVPPTATRVPPTATPVPTSSSAPPPITIPSVPITVTFNEVAVKTKDIPLNGVYPAGFINWGRNAWEVSPSWGQLSTNNLEFAGHSTKASFTLASPKRFVSVKAFNGGPDSTTISFSCVGQTTRSMTLKPGVLATVDLGWPGSCTSVTFASTNGPLTHFDDLVFTN
jgi:hypothetical protein